MIEGGWLGVLLRVWAFWGAAAAAVGWVGRTSLGFVSWTYCAMGVVHESTYVVNKHYEGSCCWIAGTMVALDSVDIQFCSTWKLAS